LGSNANTTTWQPDLVHCNDRQTGLAPAYLRFWRGHGTGFFLAQQRAGIFKVVPIPGRLTPVHLQARRSH